MADPTINQILQLGKILDPDKSTLDENFATKKKRSALRNFFGWIVYLMSFTSISRNSSLDRLTVSILKVAKENFAKDQLSSQDKAQMAEALKNLKIMIKKNSGAKGRLVDQFLKNLASTKPTSPLDLEILALKKTEQRLGTPIAFSWRDGPGKNEHWQSFEEFKIDPRIPQIMPRKTLHMPKVGTFTQVELQLFPILADFIQAVHGVEVVGNHEILTPQELVEEQIKLNIRLNPQENPTEVRNKILEGYTKGGLVRMNEILHHEQYRLEYLTPMIKTQFVHDDTSAALCFTNEGLFGGEMNFVFGGTNIGSPVGLFSFKMMGDPNQSPESFNLCLKRLMKTAIHEFGHMRGIEHCTEYCCAMQGSNHLAETDAIPFLFCAEDMAKLSFLNGTTLKESYQRQLNFFESFSTKYPNVKIDFSIEKAKLKEKIALL